MMNHGRNAVEMGLCLKRSMCLIRLSLILLNSSIFACGELRMFNFLFIQYGDMEGEETKLKT